MKKLKKTASFLLAITLLLPTIALVGCNADEDISTAPPSNSQPPPSNNVIDDSNSIPDIPIETPDSAPDYGTDDEINSAPETAPEEPPVTPVVEYAQYLLCTANSVNFRTGAGTEYSVIGQAHENEAYAILEKKGNWYKTYYRGNIAYIYASYATVFTIEKTQNKQAEQAISEGYKLLGVPYVYGAIRLHDGKGNFLSGFTTQKFDCSSLVQYMYYYGADKVLDVTTRTQVVQGEYVARENLQRGDCIYFTNESRAHLTGINRIGHVAVYLGDNYILHTASDYARIEKISATRWSYYVQTRRFV